MVDRPVLGVVANRSSLRTDQLDETEDRQQRMFASVAGVGKTYIALPFSDVKFTKVDGKDSLVVAKSKEQLEAVTKVTPNEYPELSLSSVKDRIKSNQ